MTEFYVMLGTLVFFLLALLANKLRPKEKEKIYSITWNEISEYRITIRDITKHDGYYIITDINGITYKLSQ